MTGRQAADRRPGVLDDRRVRIGLVVLVVVAIVVGLVAAVVTRSDPATQPTPTVWSAITAGIGEDGVPAEVALQAFELAYQVDVPGVELPAGRPSDDVPTSGTGIVRWLGANWNALTAEQQAVIAPFTTVQPDEAASVFTDTSGRIASLDGPGTRPRLAPSLLDQCNRPTDLNGAAPVALANGVRESVTRDLDRIGKRLGLSVIGASGATVAFSSENGGNVLMQTLALQGGLCSFSPCNITLFANSWQGQQAVNDQLHVLLTHEVVHCYQGQVAGSRFTLESIPPWITEGSALWLAADDTKVMEPMVPSQWRDGWFAWPDRALTLRTYDGYGYFALLNRLGRPLWSLMAPAWAAAAASAGNRSDPFIDVVTGDANDVRSAWAPSFLRQDGWGDPWITTGFGLPAEAQVFRLPLFAGRAPGYVGSVESRANVIRSVTGGDGEIIRIEAREGGLASVHDEQGRSSLAFQSDRFCVSGDCICPPGTERAGEQLAETMLGLPFVLAVNGPRGGATYEVEALRLEDECGKRPTPRPSGDGEPCIEGCGSSNGDPHLTTIDGQPYDFQAAGEFTLLRSPEGDVDIQARQEPYEDWEFVSINTAIAVRANDHRVGVYDTGNGFEVRIDGTVTTETAVDLGDGAAVRLLGAGVEVNLADGTTVWALDTDGYGINVVIRPSDELRQSATGVLGPAVGDKAILPALPDGSELVLPEDARGRHDALYGRFADTWQLTGESSLFDYDAGATTETYRIPGFPSFGPPMTVADLDAAARARGEAACAGITDMALRDQCIYDVGITGDAAFAAGYETTETFMTVGVAAIEETRPRPGASPTPTPDPTAGPNDTTPLAAGFVQLRGSALGPDDTVYLAFEQPNDTFQVIAADPRTDRVLATADGVGGGQLAFAAGSVWSAAGEGIEDCTISRLDPASLAVATTIDIPCFGFTLTQLGVLDDTIWVADPTGGGADGSRPRLRRIDPATNAPDDGVELPVTNGTIRNGEDAIFIGDSLGNWYRLKSGETAFMSLGAAPIDSVPAGDVLASGDLGGTRVDFYSAAGGPQSSLPVGGRFVSGDVDNLYVEHGQDPPDFVPVLYRYPRDGSTPTILMGQMRVEIQGSTYSLTYGDPATLLIGERAVVKVFTMLVEVGETSVFVRLAELP